MRFTIPANSPAYFRSPKQKTFEIPPAISESEKICNAVGCGRIIHAENFMCTRHWNMVPKELQSQIFKSVEGKQAAALHVAKLEGLR